MNVNINNKEEKTGKVKITVTRSFGTQNLMEIYTDYVVKKIREILRSEDGGKKNDEGA